MRIRFPDDFKGYHLARQIRSAEKVNLPQDARMDNLSKILRYIKIFKDIFSVYKLYFVSRYTFHGCVHKEETFF